MIYLVFHGLSVLWGELVLFAAVGFLAGGLDELLVDFIWLARALWKRSFIYSRHARVSAATLAAPIAPGLIVIFIAAWDEGAVIGAMLRYALAKLDHPDYRIYLGCYPNDQETITAASQIVDPRLRIVVGAKNGPTTKADCLNALWQALLGDEITTGVRAKAIVLHDAEDVVHPDELRVFDTLIERFALVQLPVFPLINRQSRWVAGHYADEFAEAHRKTLVVREALGAALPAAGVGCAFARDMLERIADVNGGHPFDIESLTEDYELGLKIGAFGGQGVLARLPTAHACVQINAYFPATLRAAVRQKARWIIGISLAGYDRLGWSGGLAERWMRLRDRSALIAAVVMCAGYLAVVLGAVLVLAHIMVGTPLPTLAPLIARLVAVNALLMVWRAGVRSYFVTQLYGWREGLIALPRAVVANIIAMMAARRALFQYLQMRRSGIAVWDKTAHIFPAELQFG